LFAEIENLAPGIRRSE